MCVLCVCVCACMRLRLRVCVKEKKGRGAERGGERTTLIDIQTDTHTDTKKHDYRQRNVSVANLLK